MKSERLEFLGSIRERIWVTIASASIAFTTAALSANAKADRFMANYMTTWSSCHSTCVSPPGLSFTDDWVNNFDARMRGYGHTRTFLFANDGVYSTDLIEDGHIQEYYGEDYLYGDDAEIYVFAGHGWAGGNAWGQNFVSRMCHAVAPPGAPDDVQHQCVFDAERARLGERGGPDASPQIGDARWLIWGTCQSVDTHPDQQWDQSFIYGLEAVMGYRGNSLDVEQTDEVGEDFAEEVWGANRTFKAGWFYAIEDWAVNDTGSLIVPNRATSGTLSNSTYVLDNLSRLWGRRTSNVAATGLAWAWHEG